MSVAVLLCLSCSCSCRIIGDIPFGQRLEKPHSIASTRSYQNRYPYRLLWFIHALRLFLCVQKHRPGSHWKRLECLTRVRARSVVSDKQEEGKKKTAARDINTLLCACIVCAYKQHKVLLLIVTTATQPKRKPVCERQDAMQFHSIAQAIE